MPGLGGLDLVALVVECHGRRIYRIFWQPIDVANSLDLHDLDNLVGGIYIRHLSSQLMFGFVYLHVRDIAEIPCDPL